MDSGLRLCFDGFELWPRERRLLRHGREEALGGRAFDLLQALVEGRGRVVASAELIERVWPGTAVEPNNLQVQVWNLRRLLGPHAIATVARRGYRLTLPVVARSGAVLPAPAPLRARPGGRAWAELACRHGWVTVLVAPGQDVEALRADAVGLAQDLGRTLWSLDARQLPAEPQAPPWLQRLVQGPVLLWLDKAPLAPTQALMALRAQMPDSLLVLAAAHAPLGVPDEHLCGVDDGVLPTRPSPSPQAASSLRWHMRPGQRAAPGR